MPLDSRPLAGPAAAAVSTLLLPVLFLLGAGACAKDGLAPETDAPVVVPDAGTDGPVACNELLNDTATVATTCAGTCEMCPSSGTSLEDGSYVLAEFGAPTSYCGGLSTTNARGRLRVQGDVMELVITQPGASIGDVVTSRMRYSHQIEDGELKVACTCCPSTTSRTAQSVAFKGTSDTLFFSRLPDTQGDTVFIRE